VITLEVPTVTAPNVALTKMPPVSPVLLAVKITVAPVTESRVPKVVLERLHAYVMLEGGHVAMHVGVAVKGCVLPEAIVGLVGDIATEDMVLPRLRRVITVEASMVIPFSVALTKMPPVTAVAPPVKVTATPVTALSVPRVVLVRVHAYVIPEGQGLTLHVGSAVKGIVPLVDTEGSIGLTATEERVMAAVTMSVVFLFADWLAVSLVKTLTLNIPVVEGVQASDAVLDVTQPAGRPV
jgi:hypothetical protein